MTAHLTAGPDPSTQVLAQLGAILYSQSDLPAILTRITELALQTLQGADSVSITLVDDGVPTATAHCGDLALALDERQFQTGHGPCLDAAATGNTNLIDDTLQEPRWPTYTRQAADLGGRSSLSVPLPLPDSIVGVLNAYSTRPGAFDDRAAASGLAFAGYAAVALSNATSSTETFKLAADMRVALESRAVIDQAKGILIALHGGTADDAFKRLIQQSQDSNVKVRDVANHIVARASHRGASRPGPASTRPR